MALQITVDPTVTRVDTNHVKVTGTVQGMASGGQVSATVKDTANPPHSYTGGTNVTGDGPWTVNASGSGPNGAYNVHATVNQTTPAATNSYDGPVTIS